MSGEKGNIKESRIYLGWEFVIHLQDEWINVERDPCRERATEMDALGLW